MKTIYLALVFVLTSLTIFSQNLLTNPGFETWSGGVPTGWTLTTGPGATFTPTATTSSGTGIDLQVVYPITGAITLAASQNVLPPGGASTFDTNKTYKVSVKYLVTAGDGTDARIWSTFITSAAGVTPVVNYSYPANLTDSLLNYYPLHGPSNGPILWVYPTPVGMIGNNLNGYLTDNRSSGVWQTYSYSFKFPAGITQFRFEIRSYWSSTVIWDDMSFQEIDVDAPSVPTGLAATSPNQNSFDLSWNASTDNFGVTGYDVYKDGILYGSTTNTSLTISGLVKNTSYSMTVKAKDAAGNVSNASSALVVTTAKSITYTVTVPAGTNACYIAGDMNNWDPTANPMRQIDATHYTIEIPVAFESQKYKYLSGPDWNYQEMSLGGAVIPNRSYSTSDVVLTWQSVYDPTLLPLEKDVQIQVLVPNTVLECYLVGSFNAWASPSANYKMTKGTTTSDGTLYSISIHTLNAYTLRYKFCAGPTWAYEQTNRAQFSYPASKSSVTEIVSAFDNFYNPSQPNGTINITANVPAGTDRVWMLGSQTGWLLTNPIEGTKNGNGTFSFVLPNVQTMQYKLCNQPDWNYLETDAAGLEIPNRVATYPADANLNITVLRWKQLDTAVPTAPTGLSATTPNMNSFDLTWTASTDNFGVKLYDIYKDGVFYGSTSSTSLKITGLTESASYSMTVKAKDAAGNVSNASSPLSVQVVSTPPTAPTGLQNTTPTASAFTLSWTASTDNVGVTGYDVYKDGVLYGSTASTSLAITGITEGVTYSMTVKAKDAAGNISNASTALNVVEASTPPTAPTGLQNTTPTTSAFTLSWIASTDNVGVTGYDVYKDGVLYGSTTTNTSLDITGLIAETSYSMTVKAKDAVGNISVASTALVVKTDYPPTYNISLQIGVNGTVKENNVVLLNGGTLTVNRNSTKTYTFEPIAGYEVATLTYGGVDVKSQIVNNQYTSQPVIANATLSVTFQKAIYRVALKDASFGTMNFLCEYGATPSFDFTAALGWNVNTVTFNGSDVTGLLVNGVYTVPAMTGNATLNVSFVSTQTGAPQLINNSLKVYSTFSEIIIEGSSSGDVFGVYTVEGKQILTVKSQGERIMLPAQRNVVYLIKNDSQTFKVIL